MVYSSYHILAVHSLCFIYFYFIKRKLPHGAIHWSEVCDCGISWSYWLTVCLDLPSTHDAHLRRWKSPQRITTNNQLLKIKVSVLSRKRWPIIPTFYFLPSLTHMQILHYKTSFNNIEKHCQSYHFQRKINVSLIGRSSAEWRITSPYLGTSQKATAPQQCHLVALTLTRESNFRLIHSIQTTKITFYVEFPLLQSHCLLVSSAKTVANSFDPDQAR